uniref:Ancillary SecYEG translocon subunit n=1 Tax=Candidatus Kentrum sp. LFY TaxID=2126342 RepID=A0A450V0G8_9GAMM|nr:MAG: Putative negative regulator of RcsB-dependent stress response [Candidatus Kentron sp. LFY]
MRTTYESEQEQLESLQKWWKENGKAVIIGVLLGIVGVVGWSSWQAYVVRQAEKASLGYERLLALVSDGALDEATRQGESLVGEFPSSGYAGLASLIVAKVAFEQNDVEKAKTRLRWVINEGKSSAIQSIACLRLARLLAGEEKWAEAMVLLDGDTSAFNDDVGVFSILYEEVHGDILLAQGNTDEAQSAYRRSLANSGHLTDGKLRRRVEMKLNNLGSTPELAGIPGT